MGFFMKFPIGSPLKVQGLLKPAMDLNGLNMKFYAPTFYVTTRLQKDRYGRLIDLEHVNPPSVRCCLSESGSLRHSIKLFLVIKNKT